MADMFVTGIDCESESGTYSDFSFVLGCLRLPFGTYLPQYCPVDLKPLFLSSFVAFRAFLPNAMLRLIA